MLLFDGLIDEVVCVIGLGGDVWKLVVVVVGYIFIVLGGFKGFCDKFVKVGLGEVFDFWMGYVLYFCSVSVG